MKRILSITLACVFLFSAIACSPNALAASASAESAAPLKKDFAGTELTIFLLISANYTKDIEDLEYFKWLSEQTGIKFKFERVTERSQAVERFNQMLVSDSGNPDIVMNGPNDAQIAAAAKAGKIVELTPLLEEYAPNWAKLFKENDYARKVSTMADGKIWSLPRVNEHPIALSIRDEWMINTTWLKEVGMEIPTTTDELYEVLKAFKAAAGTGSIPAGAIPWATRFNPAAGDYANGGLYELFNAFGAFSGQDFVSVDENGKIYYSASDPKMIAALQYLHKLYSEGLIAPEMFTDKQADLDSKKNGNPPVAGTFLHFANLDLDEVNYTAMEPLTSPQSSEKIWRSIENTKVARNYFTIFKSCKNVEAALYVADVIATAQGSIFGSMGMPGYNIADDGDGTYTSIKDADPNLVYECSPGVVIPFVMTEEVYGLVDFGADDLRTTDIKTKYQPYAVSVDRLLPPLVMEDDELQEMTQIKTDLLNHITITYATWIAKGGCDEASFAKFVSELNNLGLERYIQLLQDALDKFNS